MKMEWYIYQYMGIRC